MMISQRLLVGVQHREGSGGFRVSQDALIPRDQSSASITRCRHQNAVSWISVRIAGKMRAANGDAWRQLHDLHAGEARSLLDPLKRFSGERYSIALG